MSHQPDAVVEPYVKHLFVCTNQKKDGRVCCADKGSVAFFHHLKAKLKACDAPGIRISQSGCLGHCQQGPCLVMYPEGVWSTSTTASDLDAIFSALVGEDGL